MKKHKKFGIGFFLLMVLFLSYNKQVYAADCGIVDGKTTTGACCTQTSANEKYSPNVVRDTANNKIVVTVASGKFDVAVTGSIQTNKEVTPDRPAEIEYTAGRDLAIVITLTLKETDDLCLAGSNNSGLTQGEDATVRYTYRMSIEVGRNTLTTNTSYNTVCKAFREGTGYETYFEGKGIDRPLYQRMNYLSVSNEGKNFYKNQVLDYCWKQEVNTNYNETQVTQMIVNAMKSWSLRNINTQVNFVPSVGSVSVANTNTNMSGTPLKCDPWKIYNSNTSSDYYVNKNKYHTSKTEEVSADLGDGMGNQPFCRTTCNEEITVEYGAPVASKAGLCFEYKVKVTSKVSCSGQILRSEPARPQVCNVIPICNGHTGYTDQGGPNDDFDSCVNSCDNGKYTQKCINKCYKKVYGSTLNIKMPLSYDDKYSVASFVSDAGGRACGVKGEPSATPEQVYNAITNNGTGQYKWTDNGTIIWDTNQSDCYWEQLGRYYFKDLSKAYHTVLNLQGSDYVVGGVTYSGSLQGGYRIKDSFKAARECEETCRWVVDNNGDGIEDANANSTTCPYLNADEAIERYNRILTNYNTAATSCIGNASCSTSTAEFTIKVNNKTNKNPGRDNWITYDTATLTGTNKVDRDNIILDKGGCYGETSTQYDYMTEWSFPGTWINNKTGEVKYKPINNSEWHKKEGKFCTLLDSANVNKKWWNWNVKDGSPALTNTEKTAIESEVDSNQNIKATVRNFGYFKWGFDISCFYALNNKDRDCDPTVEVCDISYDNYKFRNVTTSDLFPGDDNSTLTGREAGFNWSGAATNLNNSNYEITPTALIKTIQERKNEIYSESYENKYLDYEFVLDKATINKIKKYNKTDGENNYTKYNGSTSIKNGLTVYSSNLFRHGGDIYNSNNKLGTLGCNNQAGNNCETFTDDYVNALRGSR